MNELSAYHEAGHAVVALHVGAWVRSVSVDPDWDDGPRRYADIQVEWPVNRFDRRELHEKMVCVALAGPVAEMIHTGSPDHPAQVPEWSADWSAAWEAAGILKPDARLRTEYLEDITRSVYRLLSRDDMWAALAALADELEAHETLEGDDVLDIVAQWLH